MFQIGDRVVIHSTHSKLDGKRATVLHTAPTFATVIFDDNAEGNFWYSKLMHEQEYNERTL